MLRWDRLVESELYVLDLTQRDDGIRRLKLRLATDDPHDHTVFVSQKYDGKSLCDWANSLTLAKNVKLESGDSFVEEAHGGWLTTQEYEFWRLPAAAKENIPAHELCLSHHDGSRSPRSYEYPVFESP